MKTVNGELTKEFTFFKSPIIYNALDFTPFYRVTFSCPVTLQDLSVDKNDVAEIVAEKLKQDFKKALINGSFTAEPEK
jgi:hypothetical protein